MKITITKTSTGIFDYLDLEIKSPDENDMEFISKLVQIVEKYNDEQAELA